MLLLSCKHVCRLDHPICSIQNPYFVCIRFILWARSVCCLLVPLFLLVFRFACRFKVVLVTARTTQNGGGVTVAKAQRNPCGVVVGQHNVDLPQIELSPTLIERSGANPSGFHQQMIFSSSFISTRKLSHNKFGINNQMSAMISKPTQLAFKSFYV
jgi:hypothetical protein